MVSARFTTIVITASNWYAVNAQLQRYQCTNNSDSWQSYGKTINVVVGKNGMAWDGQLKNNDLYGPIKTEGDLRTPAGLFLLSPTFGFAASPAINLKMPYLSITKNTTCVDDIKSTYYNQIIDASKTTKNSWNSGEKMAQVQGYQWGAVIQYNLSDPISSAGSCIFMNIWKSPNNGTAGCIAMPETEIKEILMWLDAKKNPMIVILPQSNYKDLMNTWQLPTLV